MFLNWIRGISSVLCARTLLPSGAHWGCSQVELRPNCSSQLSLPLKCCLFPHIEAMFAEMPPVLFLFCICFIWKGGNQRGKRERMIELCQDKDFGFSYPFEIKGKLNQGINLILPAGWQCPTYLGHHCCLSGYALAGS